jgi:iron complex outermembrane receptor protein
VSDENFLKNSKTISNLKLRLGYGQTGQQDVNNDYPYLANYSQGDPTAQYQFGADYFYVLRPAGYDANIQWEETETYNVGIDYGFLNGRLNGSLDFYVKNTSQLLSTIPVPAGSNFTNYILTNVGEMQNKGVEFSLDVIPYDSKDFTWDIGGNVTYNHNEITKLYKVTDTSTIGILTGNISGGVGNTVQIQAVGYPTYSFYVYQQNYDENGKPIEGDYTDFNGDGKITPDDRFIYQKAAPNVYAALYSSVRYKNWTAGFQLRGSWGNYLYNNVSANGGYFDNIDGSRKFINNLNASYYETQFQKAQYLSNYYVENASFVRCDNISVGYNFKNLISKKIGLTLTGVVQNVFVISGYSGLDPEVFNGIDNNIYPRPRIFSLILDLKL